MQGPETLYFLFDDQNRSYYVQNDLVLLSPTPVPLQYSPDGWQDIGIINQRNAKYFAMDRSFSIPLAFVEDGARILKDQYYKKGIEEKIYLVIAKQQLYFDATHYGFYYTLLYKGELDLSQFSHEGPKVVVNIMEGGIVKYVKANENVKYEFPVDAADTIKIKWEGINLHKSGNYSIVDGIEIKKSVYSTEFFLPVVHIINDGEAVGIAFVSQDLESVSNLSFDDKKNSPNVISQADVDNTTAIAVTIKGTVRFKCTVNDPGIGFRVRFLSSTQTQANQNAYQIGQIGNPVPGTTYELPFDITINLQPNEKLHMEGIFFGGATGAIDIGIEFLEGSDYSISFINKYKTTFVKARRPKAMFQEIAGKVTDNTATIESNALETYKSFVMVPADEIRGIAGAKYKTSLSDLFTSYNTILSLGMGVVNGKLKLERKPDWIDYSNPIDLGEGKGLKVSTATDYLFNSLKIGYQEQEYDDVNGRQEFNNTHIYTAPNTRVSKELNLVSVYRADCYGAEYLRIQGPTTTDNISDNDIWVIHVKSTPIIDPVEGEVYELDRSLNPYATGLLEPETVFNLALSPKQCLFRNGQYIRSCFYKQDTGYLRFQTTEKNSQLSVSPPGGPVITENANVEIAQLGARLFVPVKLEFETRVPFDLLEQLAIDPLKSFGTSYVGVPLVGIPNKAGIHPEDNDAQAYELLASPDTDLSQLIDVFE